MAKGVTITQSNGKAANKGPIVAQVAASVKKGEAKAAAAKKAAKKPQKPAPAPVAHAEELDSRGRRIGLRGQRQPLEDGVVTLTGEERQLLRDIASRATASKGVSAFDRAMALAVGESDVARGETLQSFAMSIAQARRHDTLGDREFNYTIGAFSPGIGHKAVSVLWITRTA